MRDVSTPHPTHLPPTNHPYLHRSTPPQNLLIFSAGNDGDIDDGRTVCTIGSPALGKNSLAVGATSSGETRLTTTGADGEVHNETNGWADVDTVASFSSYGLTQDGRIKPDVVAPGDAVREREGKKERNVDRERVSGGERTERESDSKREGWLASWRRRHCW